MSIQESSVSDRLEKNRKASFRNIPVICFSCVCVLAIAYFVMKSGTGAGSIDGVRTKADIARREWERYGKERQNAEIAQLNRLDIPDLSKRAISILVKAEHPEHIVSKAIDATEREMGEAVERPSWSKRTKPEDNKFWSIIYRERLDDAHDWWIEQNTVFRQYRLIGNPNQRVYFSIKKENKLRNVLSSIVLFGNVKSFYQVVRGDSVAPKDGCEMIPLLKAKEIFPETKNLMEGIYARHPCNQYALVPVAGFHTYLALDKATECVVLLGKMGAKSVFVSCKKGETSSLEIELEGSFKGCDATVNTSLAKAMKSNMGLKVDFSGNAPVDISPTLLENSIWHKSDTQLNGILASIMSGNKPKEWHYMEENQNDYNFDFRAAANILGIAEASLRAEFMEMKQYQWILHVTF